MLSKSISTLHLADTSKLALCAVSLALTNLIKAQDIFCKHAVYRQGLALAEI